MRLVLLGVVLALPLLSQSNGSLAGRVLDAAGVPVEAATVRAKNPQSGAAFTGTTSSAGRYTIANLPPGFYDVSVTGVPAMSGFERKGVAIEGKAATLDIRLDFNTQLGTLGEDRVNLAADLRRHNPPDGPAPRTKEGKPDLSGVWWRPVDIDSGNPQFLPAAEEMARMRRAANSKDSPQARCLPGAVLRYGPLVQFVQGQDSLVIINDDESPGFHQVYLNARHPADPNPGWYGHNVATWDGDTLVVDRIAFDERIWLDQGAHPHSPQLHVIERYRRPDLGHLEIETTVEDPGVLAKPFTMKRAADLAQGYNIYEFICAENERDVPHLVGK
jgi:hypothetical protein